MSDLAELFELASTQLRRVVVALREPDWARPTNCEVTVHELVEHVVAGNVFAVRLLAGVPDARAGLEEIRLGADPVGDVERTCRAQIDAFAGADRSQLLAHPSGPLGFEAFARLRLVDLTLHAWDVAIAAGLDATLEAELVVGLWALVEPHLDAMRALGAYGTPAAPGVLESDSDVQVRLLRRSGGPDWSGRITGSVGVSGPLSRSTRWPSLPLVVEPAETVCEDRIVPNTCSN